MSQQKQENEYLPNWSPMGQGVFGPLFQPLNAVQDSGANEEKNFPEADGGAQEPASLQQRVTQLERQLEEAKQTQMSQKNVALLEQTLAMQARVALAEKEELEARLALAQQQLAAKQRQAAAKPSKLKRTKLKRRNFTLIPNDAKAENLVLDLATSAEEEQQRVEVESSGVHFKVILVAGIGIATAGISALLYWLSNRNGSQASLIEQENASGQIAVVASSAIALSAAQAAQAIIQGSFAAVSSVLTSPPQQFNQPSMDDQLREVPESRHEKPQEETPKPRVLKTKRRLGTRESTPAPAAIVFKDVETYLSQIENKINKALNRIKSEGNKGRDIWMVYKDAASKCNNVIEELRSPVAQMRFPGLNLEETSNTMYKQFVKYAQIGLERMSDGILGRVKMLTAYLDMYTVMRNAAPEVFEVKDWVYLEKLIKWYSTSTHKERSDAKFFPENLLIILEHRFRLLHDAGSAEIAVLKDLAAMFLENYKISRGRLNLEQKNFFAESGIMRFVRQHLSEDGALFGTRESRAMSP